LNFKQNVFFFKRHVQERLQVKGTPPVLKGDESLGHVSSGRAGYRCQQLPPPT
jgi:hypothetical protein